MHTDSNFKLTPKTAGGTMNLEITELQEPGYERVIEARDSESGLHAIIAVHSTEMGPALGGTRMYPYKSREEALTDVLRLSRGMTYKSAVAEIGLGGGKSVIIGDPKTLKSEALLLAFAQAVDSLGGKYICAEDMGTTLEDMATIRRGTRWVTALPSKKSSGDPSRFTAWGCYRGIKAVSQWLWNTRVLRDRTIAIQGLGSVGFKLAEHLFWEGARLIVADIDHDHAKRVGKALGAQVTTTDDILHVPCDILSPCAIGGILNKDTIPRLHCTAVAGAANNQLLTQQDGAELMQRGILYAPDFVINSGGIINVACELEPEGYDPCLAREKVATIYDTLLNVFEVSERRNIPTSVASDELAKHKLQYGIGRRSTSVHLHH